MKRNSLLIILSLVTLVAKGQQKNALFNGKVVNDSVSVENIHIINKNYRRVAITNAFGEFEIPVQLNDTLVFSAVQFEPYQRIVIPQDLQKLQVVIRLKIQTNKLGEVRLERNSIAVELGLPNAANKPKTKLEARIDGHSKANATIVVLDAILIGPLLGKKGGINNLYYLFSGERKKDRKLQKLLQEDQIIELNNNTAKKIQQHFTEDFFVCHLKIPAKQIDAFIRHCMEKGLADLYLQNQKIQLIELMLAESLVFLETVNHEKK